MGEKDSNLQRGEKVNDVVQKKAKKKSNQKKPKQNDGVLKVNVLRFVFNEKNHEKKTEQC